MKKIIISVVVIGLLLSVPIASVNAKKLEKITLDNSLIFTHIAIHGSNKMGTTNGINYGGFEYSIVNFGKDVLTCKVLVEVGVANKIIYKTEVQNNFSPKTGNGNSVLFEPVEKNSLGYIMIKLDDGVCTKIKVVPIIISEDDTHHFRYVTILPRPITRLTRST